MAVTRATLSILAVLILAAAPAFAQQTDHRAALKRKGSIKVWVGAGLVGAGALALPLTAVAHTPSRDYRPPLIGVGLMATGGSLIWFGVQDQRKAMRPQTTIGVVIGRTSAVQIRKPW